MGPKTTVTTAHLVGIGGAGMSGLARLLRGLGVKVSGSDLCENESIVALRKLGIAVEIGHRKTSLPAVDSCWLVHSAAIPEHNPELFEARRRGWDSLLYSEAVGRLSDGLRTLSIAGTHGKSTTTAMTVTALLASGLDPSYLIGAEVPSLATNGHGGKSDLFVVEACEFNRSFHSLRPTLAAILNLDSDHFDCYPDREALEESFALYARNLRPGGSLLLHEEVTEEVLRLLPAKIAVISIGTGLYCDLSARDLSHEFARYSFTPYWDREALPRIELKVAGHFQVGNALFALGLAILAGADPKRACIGLSGFEGVRRRFQIHEGRNGGALVDDYAHHPREISAVLHAVRRAYPGRKILAAFQPHQHSRTRNLLEDFGQALARADTCLIADIYAAREDPNLDHGVDSRDLAKAIRAAGGKAVISGPLPLLGRRILGELKPGYIPVILGAGELDGVVAEVVRGL